MKHANPINKASWVTQQNKQQWRTKCSPRNNSSTGGSSSCRGNMFSLSQWYYLTPAMKASKLCRTFFVVERVVCTHALIETRCAVCIRHAHFHGKYSHVVVSVLQVAFPFSTLQSVRGHQLILLLCSSSRHGCLYFRKT